MVTTIEVHESMLNATRRVKFLRKMGFNAVLRMSPNEDVCVVYTARHPLTIRAAESETEALARKGPTT